MLYNNLSTEEDSGALSTLPNPSSTNLIERSANVSKYYQKIPVQCKDCGKGWLKAASTIPEWQGRCKSCAGKLTGRLSAPTKVECVSCGETTATIKTNPCAKCNGRLQVKRLYHEVNRVDVSCCDCGITWSKARQTIAEWKGRCRSCAAKLVATDPDFKTRKSERSRVQVLRQGGVPNAVKITRERSLGENNPKWKGGITPHVMRIRYSQEYKQWRFAVFTRDNFTCVLCNVSASGKLHADHFPKPFSHIFEEYLPLGIDAKDHGEFWDIDNGRTLCADCHNKYGWRPNREAVDHNQ